MVSWDKEVVYIKLAVAARKHNELSAERRNYLYKLHLLLFHIMPLSILYFIPQKYSATQFSAFYTSPNSAIGNPHSRFYTDPIWISFRNVIVMH